MNNDIGYIDGKILKISVENIDELNMIIKKIKTKEKELQDAVHELSLFDLKIEFTQKK